MLKTAHKTFQLSFSSFLINNQVIPFTQFNEADNDYV